MLFSLTAWSTSLKNVCGNCEQERGGGRRVSLYLCQETLFLEPALTAIKSSEVEIETRSEKYIRNDVRKCFLLLTLVFFNVLSRVPSTEDDVHRPKKKANTN